MNKTCDQDSIKILVAPHADSAGIGDFLTPVPVKLKTLKENLEALTNKLGTIIPEVSSQTNYELSDISVNVNVTASGELQLVGIAKGKGEVSGGFTLTFRKTKEP